MRDFISSKTYRSWVAAALLCSGFTSLANAQAPVLLNAWDDPNELALSPSPGGPVLPDAITMPNGQGTTPINGAGTLPFSLSGRWYAKDENGSITGGLGSDVRISHSTDIGVVSDDPDFPGSTGAIKITQGGSSRGGGDTHYNFTAAGIYFTDSFLPGEENPLLASHPKGEALLEARDNPDNWVFEFDVTYDVENMIVRNPTTDAVMNWFPNPNLSVGIYMSSGVQSGGNNWITNNVFDPGGDGGQNILSGNQQFDLDEDEELSDLSDAPGFGPGEAGATPPVTRHAAVRFPPANWPTLMEGGGGSLFNFPMDTQGGRTGPMPVIAVGFVLNGNWDNGSVDSPTSSQSVYIDNLKLTFRDPFADALLMIDFDNDGMATLADFGILAADHLLPPETYPEGMEGDDLCVTCWWDHGDVDRDGDNDFDDFVAFEQKFNFVNDAMGMGSLAEQLAAAGVPEPSSILLLLGAVAAGLYRPRRALRKALPCAAVLAVALSAGAAQAQLLESWETDLGGWELVGGGVSDAIGLDTGHFSLGSQSMLITHEEPGNDASPDIASVFYNDGDPQFAALANAVNLGAELFRLKMDVIYDTVDLFEVQDVGVALYMGTNQGNNRLGNDPDMGGGLAQWFSGDGNATIPIDVSLSDFAPTGGHLGDVEADGNTQFQIQIGLNGTQTELIPFTVYFDNLRLEQIDTPDFLTLEVNRGTGEVKIKNNDDEAIDFSYYEIRSAAGGINSAAWNSLDDQEGADNPGEGWDEAGGVNDNVLAELRLLPTGGQGEATLAPSAEMSLGMIYDTGMDTQDMVFQYRRQDRPNKLIGDGPELISPDGDYNENGFVDAADYTLYRDLLGQAVTLPNENPLAMTPGMVDQEDYDFWAASFGNTGDLEFPADYLVQYINPGSGALGAGTVPEPTTVTIAGVALLASLATRRCPRKSCRCVCVHGIERYHKLFFL